MSDTLASYCKARKLPVVCLDPGDGNRLPIRRADMYCGVVEGVIIFGKSYFRQYMDNSAKVFLRQSHRDNKPADFSSYYTREIVKREADNWVAEECCFLGGLSGEDRYFGHFIFEFLYRVHAFAMAGVGHLPVAVYDTVPDSWLSFLRLYGVKDFIRIPQSPARAFRRAWITTAPCHLMADGQHYAFWDAGIRAVRQRLLDQTGPGASHKRVFIGRKDASHRKLVNEAGVWEILKGEGFVYADVAGLGAADQIRLVRDAEVIITVGGSGSVLTHFAPATCQIIELLAPHLVGVLGSLGVAAVLGQGFSRIPTPVVGEGLHADTVVDLRAIRAVLSRVT